MKKIRRKIDGVLLVDKPLGMSSNGAIQQIKRLLNAEKVGHTGTLDPLASGLLPVCLGEATKFASYLLDGDKEYLATAQLGVITDSGDSEGQVVSINEVSVSLMQLTAAFKHYTTSYLQIPPMYSALKYHGKPLYEYARAGIEIERLGRMVTIHELELMGYDQKQQQVSFRCVVSKGTYIRTLAEDIGNFLSCGASLVSLRRTASNDFRIEQATDLKRLANLVSSNEPLPMLSCTVLIKDLAQYHVTPMEYSIIKYGNVLGLLAKESLTIAKVALFANNRFLGVGEIDPIANQLRPKRLISGLSEFNPWL